MNERLKWFVGKVWYLLKTPSSFKDDPWGMLRNQVGHGVVLGTVFTLLLGLYVGMILYACIELIQYLLFKAEVWDNVRDFAYYTTFSLFVFTGVWWFVFVYALFLASDFFERYKQKD